MSTPIAALNRMQLTCDAEPAPAWPYFAVPFLALRSVMNSCNVSAGKFFGVIMTLGASTTSPRGVKSVSVL